MKEINIKGLSNKKRLHSKVSGREKHTLKMSNLAFIKLELQPYLIRPLFGGEDTQMLLSLRTRTVRGVKRDFKGMFQDVQCTLKCGDVDTLPYVHTCQVLKTHFKSEELTRNRIPFQIYTASTHIQNKRI